METEKIKELKMVLIDELLEYGLPQNMCQLIRSGFPGRGSYQGDFETFYGRL
jgi:hypothetical protein